VPLPSSLERRAPIYDGGDCGYLLCDVYRVPVEKQRSSARQKSLPSPRPIPRAMPMKLLLSLAEGTLQVELR